MLRSGTAGPDGRELVVAFTGGSKRLFHYDAEIIETPSAVCVVPLRRLIAHLAPGTRLVIPAVGFLRTLRVTLTEPLGGRVLVNLDGTPVAVSPAEEDTDA